MSLAHLEDFFERNGVSGANLVETAKMMSMLGHAAYEAGPLPPHLFS